MLEISRLGSHHLRSNYSTYRRELGARLSSPHTHIIVDTNILALPYKLSDKAQTELFTWLEYLASENRVWVPAWCAHEYVAKVIGGNVSYYMANNFKLESAKTELSKIVDSARRISSDSGLIAVVESECEKLKTSLTSVSPSSAKDKAHKIHSKIIETLEKRVWPTAVVDLVERHSTMVEHRYRNRIPPGYKDAGKDSNAGGDVMLWLEIVEWLRCTSIPLQHIVFWSEDQKVDWCYKPQYRRQDGESGPEWIPNSNPELRVLDPRLQQELLSKSGKEVELHIVPTAEIAAGMSENSSGQFQSLSQAYQVRPLGAGPRIRPQQNADHSGASATDTIDPDSVPAAPQAESPPEYRHSAENSENALHFGDEAMADSGFKPPSQDMAAEYLDKLKSRNWYLQNDAVTDLLAEDLAKVDSDTLFVLGRNIYQAACGNAWEARSTIKQFAKRASRHSVGVQRSILAGMAFEVYFGADGELRSACKVDALDDLASLLFEQTYEPVRQFVVARLLAHEASVRPINPSSESFEFVLVPLSDCNKTDEEEWETGPEIATIKFEDTTIYTHTTQGNKTSVSPNELKATLCAQYALPPKCVTLRFDRDPRPSWYLFTLHPKWKPIAALQASLVSLPPCL